MRSDEQPTHSTASDDDHVRADATRLDKSGSRNDTGVRQPLVGTQSLERGLQLIGLVVDKSPTLDEMSRLSGLNISATRRLIAGLENQGFVSFGPDRRLYGGSSLIRYGLRAQSHLDVVGIARPILADLSEATGMPSFLGERSGHFSIHLHRASGRHRVVVNTPVGTRRHLSETSLGKALLLDDEAEWPVIMATGQSPQDETWRPSMLQARDAGYVHHVSSPPDSFHAFAAPVRGATGEIVAAISIVSLPQYVDAADLPRLGSTVAAAALSISSELGFASEDRNP